MAELASGAVSSLLGLLRNEALLLSRVGSDVEFIKEEMESMHSFLEHLSRTTPRTGGGHDEQVGTWMKQVQDLAHDCSNCVDLYIRLGDPAVFRARAGRWRYLWWAYWLVQRMGAQHKAAIRLRELKERARDVGQRRLRYGVELPGRETTAKEALSSVTTDDEEGEEEDIDQNQVLPLSAVDGSDDHPLEPRVLEEYFAEKLAKWLKDKATQSSSIASTAIVAPDVGDAGAIARELLMNNNMTTGFENKIFICLAEVHNSWDLPLQAPEILCYIMRQCTKPQNEAYRYKEQICWQIWEKVSDEIDVWDKIDKIKTSIGQVDSNKLEETKRLKSVIDKQRLVLLIALQLLQNEHTHPTTLSRDEIIEEAASKLRAHMGMEPGAGKPKPSICLELSQYKDILKKAFPESKTPQSQAQEAASTVTAATSLGLGEDYIKEIINNHRITLDIILGLLPKPPIILQASSDSDANKEQTTAGAVASVIEQGKEISAKEATPPDSDSNKEQTTAGVAASVIEQGKEISTKEATPSDSDANKEQTTAGAVASVAKEATDETKEKLMELSAAVIKETKQKLKDISGQVTSDVVADVITEARKKLKQISGDVVADVVTEARKKLKEISGEVESTIKEETMERMSQIRWAIQEQLLTKGVVDKLKPHLEAKKTLIVLQDDEDYISQWEETRNALSLLNCAPGSAVIVCTKKSEKAKEFCNQDEEPITCSLVGFYHDKMMLNLKQKQVENSQILRDILDRCHPHDFCMRIFADALFANPKRSQEDLQKLQEDLIPQGTFGSKAKKMLKFSYKDLPREYKTCLLHLAIFPQGYNIRRSTLIGRWVTEGLITKQDWRTTVHHAEQCFDALIKRGLVLPCDIGAAGKVKSCMVGDRVHGFITKIANKQHILDARLSDLWARHFSIFSGIRLRTSDRIDKFVQGLTKYSPQLPLLKVLDLEGTNCFDKNYYLKDICKKILLLKYLSLRRTNVSHLPSEINNLHELEVLDIRETKVHEDATRHVLLLKLRRFLADRVDQSSGMNGKPSRFAVRIPLKIEKMENLEVLTNVKASRAGKELNNIRNLWQLRKLGVVIEDREDQLSNLFRAITDLKESLLSLSITISKSRPKSIPSSKEQPQKGRPSWSIQTPKYLESLTINGVSQGVQLLELLAKASDGLAKVTLSGTLLEQDSLMVLAVLPKLRCVRLRSHAYNGSKLTFRKEEFQHLKYFLAEGTIMNNKKETKTDTDIIFEDGATAELEKIVMSFTNIRSLGGVDNLPKLKELELETNQFLHSFSHNGAAHEQNTESRGLDQSMDNTSKVSMQNIESTAPERNNEKTGAEQNTQSSSTDEQITHSSVSDENNQSRASEQSPEIKAPKQSTETRVSEENTDSRFTFKKDKFQHLVYFRFKDSKMTNIIFEPGGAPELKKIALSLDNTRSKVTGISGLPKLKEVELKGNKFLLSFFDEANQIAKITLRDTQMKQADIQNLAKKQNLRCLVLSDKSYDQSQLTFNKDEFRNLDLLIVECHKINIISFTQESAPNLKKIIWSFTNMKSLSGINKLLKLKEIECRGEFVPHHVRRDIAAHQNQLVLTHKKPQEQVQAEETSTPKDDDDDGDDDPKPKRFPSISPLEDQESTTALAG